MERAIVAAVLALTVGQASSPYAGTWIAEFSGTTHIRLELRLINGALGGGMSLGDIEVNAEGAIRTAAEASRELSPIFDVTLRDATLSFSRKDGDDIDRFEMRLVGDQAEIRFIPSEEDRRELAEIGVAVPKPVRLKRLAP
jgi:hypothetical protein